MVEASFSREHRCETVDAHHVHVQQWQSPGENGVRLARLKLDASAHLRVTSSAHWIDFALAGATRIDCRIADQRRLHTLGIGTMALLPAGADAAAETDGPTEFLALEIASSRVAVAAAERGAPAAGLVEQLAGRDDELRRLAVSLYAEARDGYVNGPLFWNEVADRIVEHLLVGHLSQTPGPVVGSLSPAMRGRLADYIATHIADPLDVASLAAVAGVSPYHFTRIFARGVGMTPHRYVVKLRLERAVSLARERRLPLAEVALATGFADQSHLSRWVRRVYGTTLSRLAS